MGSLSAFLHPEQTGNKEVIVSERFKENGKLVPIVIRPITQQENEELIRRYTKKDKKAGTEALDRLAYNQALTAAAVVEPDLNNAELQKAYGVLGAPKTLTAMLYAGEFAALMQHVQELSGIDTDINEDIEDAKNESGRENQS